MMKLFIITVLLTTCNVVRAGADILTKGLVARICAFILPVPCMDTSLTRILKKNKDTTYQENSVPCLNASLTRILRKNQYETYQENRARLFRLMHPMNALHAMSWILEYYPEVINQDDYANLNKANTILENIFRGSRDTLEQFQGKLLSILPMVMRETLLYLRREAYTDKLVWFTELLPKGFKCSPADKIYGSDSALPIDLSCYTDYVKNRLAPVTVFEVFYRETNRPDLRKILKDSFNTTDGFITHQLTKEEVGEADEFVIISSNDSVYDFLLYLTMEEFNTDVAKGNVCSVELVYIKNVPTHNLQLNTSSGSEVIGV